MLFPARLFNRLNLRPRVVKCLLLSFWMYIACLTQDSPIVVLLEPLPHLLSCVLLRLRREVQFLYSPRRGLDYQMVVSPLCGKPTAVYDRISIYYEMHVTSTPAALASATMFAVPLLPGNATTCCGCPISSMRWLRIGPAARHAYANPPETPRLESHALVHSHVRICQPPPPRRE